MKTVKRRGLWIFKIFFSAVTRDNSINQPIQANQRNKFVFCLLRYLFISNQTTKFCFPHVLLHKFCSKKQTTNKPTPRNYFNTSSIHNLHGFTTRVDVVCNMTSICTFWARLVAIKAHQFTYTYIYIYMYPYMYAIRILIKHPQHKRSMK